jgi:hypothetical protein
MLMPPLMPLIRAPYAIAFRFIFAADSVFARYAIAMIFAACLPPRRHYYAITPCRATHYAPLPLPCCCQPLPPLFRCYADCCRY